MKRFEHIKNMTVNEMAEIITDKYSEVFSEEYCNSDCGLEDCVHETSCCIKWLLSEMTVPTDRVHNGSSVFKSLGKTVFLTKEATEQAVKGVQ